jgi:hypothetical protein
MRQILLRRILDERMDGDFTKSSAKRQNNHPSVRLARRFVLTIAAAVAVLVLDATTPLSLAVWILQVVLVWVATSWATRRQIVAVAAVCATFIVIGCWWSPKTGPLTWVDASNLLLGLGTVSALTHSCLRRMATEDARRNAARELGKMIRIVSQLLPICPWCQRVRNETGTWEQMEIYIRNHSHVGFRHGMCQECAARFDP